MWYYITIEKILVYYFIYLLFYYRTFDYSGSFEGSECYVKEKKKRLYIG